MSSESRPHKDPVTILVVVLSPVAANLAALALQLATASDTSPLPAAVAPLRDHPWLGYVVCTLVSAVFAARVWRRDQRPVDVAGNKHTHASVPLQAPPDLATAASPTGSVQILPPTGAKPPRLCGRDREMISLVELHRTSGQRTQVLAGLGGCGKTAVALTFAIHMAERKVTVWWIRARSRRAYVEGMLAVAAAAGAADVAIQRHREEDSVEITWQAVGRLADSYVLVIDGVDDPALLGPVGHPALVTGRHAFVLVTSRVVEPEAWGREAEVMRLAPLSRQAAGQMLLDRIPTRWSAKTAEAEAIAERLGRLPLALHLAGRYLGSGVTDSDPAHYLDVLERESVRFVDIAARAGHLTDGGDAEQQVFHTWEVSVTALEAHGESRARRLLRYLSMFSFGQPIPVSLVRWELLHGTGLLTGDRDDAHDIQFRALSGLRRFGLVEPHSDSGAIVLHPLVAEVSLLHLPNEDEDPALLLTTAATALRAECDRRDPGEPDDWPVWQLLVPHATALVDRLPIAGGGALRQVLDAVSPVVRHLRRFGLYTVARILATRAAEAAEHFGGKETDLLLGAQHDLALVHFDCGDFDEAERLHLRVLRARADDPAGTLTTLHHLGLVLRAKGRIEQAETMLRRVLDRRADQLGADHPSTMTVRHDLAATLHATGKFAEAEALLRTVLADRRARRGPIHPDTLSTMHALAYARQARGDVRGATALFQQVLAGRRERLGDTHPDTLITRHNLAWLVHLSGDYANAERQLQSVLTAQVDRLGAEHPHTLATRANIAWVLLLQERYAASYVLFEEVLRTRRGRLGPDHPDTLTTRGNIAWLRNEEGNWAEAERLLRELVTDRERVLGANHPRTLTTRHNLAQALQPQGKLGEAEQIFADVLRCQEATLGETNPSTLATKHNLALVWQAQGRLAEAQTGLREVLDEQARQLGEHHPDVAKTASNLDVVLRAQVRRRRRRSAGWPWLFRRGR